MKRTSGFSLIEVMVALALFALAAAFAAQLLLETTQQLTDAAAEQAESPMPLVRARLRADIQASHTAECILRLDGTLEAVRLSDHPAGEVTYRVDERVLWRQVEKDMDPILREVESWTCADGGGLLFMQLAHWRRAVRRTPLIVEPGARGPLNEPRMESLLVAPRGAGLGEGW